MRCVVSVEGLPVPSRLAVLKSLQARLGLVPVPDLDRGDSLPGHQGTAASLDLLLHRVRALSKLPEGTPALWSGSWLLSMPRDPDLQHLHRDLAKALCSRYFPEASEAITHIMLCVEASPHEAFEHIFSDPHQQPRDRDTSIQDLHLAHRTLREVLAGRQQAVTPFRTQIVEIAAPPFAADTPGVLAELLDLACAACERALRET